LRVSGQLYTHSKANEKTADLPTYRSDISKRSTSLIDSEERKGPQKSLRVRKESFASNGSIRHRRIALRVRKGSFSSRGRKKDRRGALRVRKETFYSMGMKGDRRSALRVRKELFSSNRRKKDRKLT
jgi:hypothetical protein